MAQFVLTNILMISLGVVLYLAIRTLPRIDESGPPERRRILERWLASEVPAKIDSALNNFLLKTLRRMKIFVMKIDNAVTSQLSRLKSQNGAPPNQPPLDFKAIKKENKKEEPRRDE